MNRSAAVGPTIGIDARKLGDFGVGTYIRGLVSALVPELPALGAGTRLVLFAYPGAELTLPGFPASVSWIETSAPRYGLRELVGLSRLARRERLDLFHAPHYVLPLALPCPAVVTVHDLIHLRYPGQLPHRAAWLYARWMLGRAARATRVIAPTRATADDLVARVGADRARLRVVPIGIEQRFFDARGGGFGAATLRRLGIGGRYLLHAGNPKPHKGVEDLVRAFGAALPRLPPDVRLVLAGERGDRARWHRLAAAAGAAGRIDVLGFVDDAELPALFAGALAFVFPSHYEGFGLPMVEAMAAGVPVVATSTPALAEVAGDAALLVPPANPPALAEALVRVAGEAETRAGLVERGATQAAGLRWRDAARGTLAVYREALA